VAVRSRGLRPATNSVVGCLASASTQPARAHLNSPPETLQKTTYAPRNSSFGWCRISKRLARLSCGIGSRLARDSHPKCIGLRRLFFPLQNRLSIIRLPNYPDGSTSRADFPDGVQFGTPVPKNADARSPGAESAYSARPVRGYGLPRST